MARNGEEGQTLCALHGTGLGGVATFFILPGCLADCTRPSRAACSTHDIKFDTYYQIMRNKEIIVD